MTYNKQKNAALFNGLLSSLKPVTNPAEHIFTTKQFMNKVVTSLLLLLCSISLSGACDFPTLGNGTTCQSAIPMCGDNLTVTGDLPTATVMPPFPNLCNEGSIENAVWYQFIACESTVSIQVCPGACTDGVGGTGMQASIATGCAASTYIVCDVEPNENCFILTENNFTPGETYYLILDGYGGSVCDYTVNVLSGIYDDNYTLTTGVDNEISHSPIDDCMQESDLVQIDVSECTAVGGACTLPTLLNSSYVCYEWTFNPPTVDITSADDVANIEVQFLQEGEYTVSVERFLHPFLEACAEGSCDDPLSITIDINFIDTIYNPKQIICPGDVIQICGNPVGIDGVYECLDEANCILTIDTLAFPEQEIIDLGLIYLCPDECYEIENIEYCDRDIFVIESDSNCATVYEFELRDLFIEINEPSEYPVLDCNLNPELVNMNVTTNYENDLNFLFVDPNGIEISSEAFSFVDMPGEYTFYVFSPDFALTCVDSIKFTIEINDTAPQFTLDGEDLTCTEREAALSFSTLDMITSFEWTGPAVNNPTGLNAYATEPGTYYFEGIGENGCSGFDSIVIDEDLLPADINIDFENLNCEIAMTTLSIISDVAIDSVVWTGPFDFIDKSMEPMVTDTGTYIASMFAENGCNYTEIIKILGFYQEPSFDISQSIIWDCETESVTLSTTIISGSSLSYNWTTSDGEILSNEFQDEVTVGSTGEYFLEVVDGENGCSTIDTFSIETDPNIPSSIILEATNPSCFSISDGMIEIGEIEGGVDPFTFILNDVEVTEAILTDLEAGTYNFTLIDDNGCELERTIVLEMPLEIQAEIEVPDMAVFDEVIQLSSIYDDTLFNIDEVNWYDSNGEFIGSGDNINFTVQGAETFTMEVIDENGCVVIKTRSISLDEDYDYYEPNTFTPNGDGLNDIFGIFSQTIPGEIQEFIVFDRWGNRVYELQEVVTLPRMDVDWGWDGSYQGKNVAAGIYVYYAVVETLGVKKELKGSVTLIR